MDNITNKKDIATEINNEYTNTAIDFIEHIKKLGYLLNIAKQKHEEKDFETWIKNNLVFSRTQAFKYMEITNNWHLISTTYPQIEDLSTAVDKTKNGGKLVDNLSLNMLYKCIKKNNNKTEEKVIIDPPDGLFDVVSVDPPWKYGREYDPDSSRVASPYPEMDTKEIIENIPPFADDVVLWLWTTHAFMRDAYKILDTWGFTYKATLIWDKEKMGMGVWLRMQCEFCLLAVKGKPQYTNKIERDIIREPRREHSRKPEAFYKLVENICHGTKRLNFYSRENISGWVSYGNEKDKFDGMV